MEKGTVKFFNESKGFGFIKRENGSPDIFVHVSECRDELREEDEVTFDVKESNRGLNAVNVHRS
jgi:cold shock protein